ncbi:MAG TPA: prolipoprotein diacylglyceryl transferase family protein [Pirellulaceae bacterium]
MRTTLFFVPAELAGWPVFGFGWMLLAWIVLAVVAGLILWQRPSARRELPGYLPVFLLVAAVIAFVLPTLVEAGPSGKPIGLPIRGYGVMMMLGTVCGVGLAAYRAWQVGIDPEMIYSLAIAMFLAGIVGARLFYVIEYWNQEFSPQRTGSVLATIQTIVNVPKGGLVVYGSVLFGVPAGVWFCRKRGLQVLKIGDVIAPSMVVGLSLGRLGCFLNGCCFGGVCLTHDYALTFPADSPPYLQQERYGWRSGVWLEVDDRRDALVVGYVAPDGAAAAAGLRPGDQVLTINGSEIASLDEARQKLAAASTSYEIQTPDHIVRWTSAKPPPRSVPIHAAQLYAAIDAALMAAVLWFYFPFRRRDGEVFAILLTFHPISRFLIEMIRSDEPKYPLTISQWISIGLVIAGIVLWIAIERGPRRSTTAAAAG